MMGKTSASGVVSLAVFCVLLLGGCGSEKPVRTMTNAETSLHRAREAKAIDYAPLQLKLAQDKLQAAQQAMDKGDNKQAKSLAEEARAHAQLAEAEAKSEQSQRMALEMRRNIETLHQLASQSATRTQ